MLGRRSLAPRLEFNYAVSKISLRLGFVLMDRCIYRYLQWFSIDFILNGSEASPCKNRLNSIIAFAMTRLMALPDLFLDGTFNGTIELLEEAIDLFQPAVNIKRSRFG
jgi:hypothetical protein